MLCSVKHLPADTLTPVGIYLRLRDEFPQSLLLECSDFSSREDAYSYICLNPVAGIEIAGDKTRLYRPGEPVRVSDLHDSDDIVSLTGSFAEKITLENKPDEKIYPGLFGFTSWEAVKFFDNVNTGKNRRTSPVPLLKYDLYSVVVAINHFNNTMTICEIDNVQNGHTEKIVSLLSNRNTATFPFRTTGPEIPGIDDDRYLEMVMEGKKHCSRGNVLQIVLSRRFEQAFQGDEFQVYRALRSVNPSPYLFYFDYLKYKLFGSSPEAQLQVNNGTATINPIAGTFRRSGNRLNDEKIARDLAADPKENSEHSMLVDLARNDLSRHSRNVKVKTYKEVHAYSHVIHLVSTVTGELKKNVNNYRIFADTFPAGTLSGAPKHRAIELISQIEAGERGYYGGALGYIGLEGSLNHAIMIRSFASYDGKLVYQAGAGIINDSVPQKELEEVGNKLSALRQALKMAEAYNGPLT